MEKSINPLQWWGALGLALMVKKTEVLKSSVRIKFDTLQAPLQTWSSIALLLWQIFRFKWNRSKFKFNNKHLKSAALQMEISNLNLLQTLLRAWLIKAEGMDKVWVNQYKRNWEVWEFPFSAEVIMPMETLWRCLDASKSRMFKHLTNSRILLRIWKSME
jgi:hypothetical protein